MPYFQGLKIKVTNAMFAMFARCHSLTHQRHHGTSRIMIHDAATDSRTGRARTFPFNEQLEGPGLHEGAGAI